MGGAAHSQMVRTASVSARQSGKHEPFLGADGGTHRCRNGNRVRTAAHSRHCRRAAHASRDGCSKSQGGGYESANARHLNATLRSIQMRSMIRLTILGLAGYGAWSLYEKYGQRLEELRGPVRELSERATKRHQDGSARGRLHGRRCDRSRQGLDRGDPTGSQRRRREGGSRNVSSAAFNGRSNGRFVRALTTQRTWGRFYR